MIKVYEKRFNEKIDHFKDHPKYSTLRESANGAIKCHTGYGLDAIHAQDFMDRIVKMPIAYILAWLNGENQLEWIDQQTKEDYSTPHLADILNNPIN